MGTEGTGTIRDARGRTLKLLDPVTLHVLHRYEIIEAETLERIVEDLEPGTARMRRWLIFLIPGSIVLLVGFVGLLYALGDTSARADLVAVLLNPAIMTPSIVCSVMIPWITARQARMRRVSGVMLFHKRCTHCGYNLRGLPAEPEDGATLCPECGAAWRLDEVTLEKGPLTDTISRGRALTTAALLALTFAAGLAAYLLY